MRDGDLATAGAMLERLSHLLRSVLQGDRSPTLSLADDLQLALDYLAIEQVRFPDRLGVTCSLPEELLALQVPVLRLQALFGAGAGCELAREGDRTVATVRIPLPEPAG